MNIEEVAKEYINSIESISIQSLVRKYKCAPMRISNKVRELGGEVINHLNIIKFNEHIFDIIDTEEKAYWLGFIFADGNIASKRYTFELTLAEIDYNHLIKFNKFVNFNKLPSLKKVKLKDKIFISYRISFNSKHFWNTLNNLGCTPKKSLVLKFPKLEIFTDVSFINDFIRGYFDGDGCITHLDKDKKIIAIHICGTVSMLNTINNLFKIENKANVFTNKGVPTLTYVKDRAFNICNQLYNNANIYLERKYLLYKKYCRLYSEEYKLLQTNIGEKPYEENPEISIECKKSMPSYSVEIETINVE